MSRVPPQMRKYILLYIHSFYLFSYVNYPSKSQRALSPAVVPPSDWHVFCLVITATGCTQPPSCSSGCKTSQQVWLACSCPGASRLINFCLPGTDQTLIAPEFFHFLIYIQCPCEQQTTYLLKTVHHHTSPPVPDALNHSSFIDYAF